MKQYKAYSFQRISTSSNSNPPPSSSSSPPFPTPLQTDSFKLSFTNNQPTLNSSTFTPQFPLTTLPSNPKETYENKLAQLELRITNLERTFRIFETFLSPHPKQSLDEITKDIYSRLQSIENSNKLTPNNSYNNNIDQLILDKIAPIKLSLYQNLNEVKGTVTQLTELHIKQGEDIVVIQKTLGQFKSNMDIFSKDLYELTQSVNQILEFVSNEIGHEKNRNHNDINNNESFVNETNNNYNNNNVFVDDYVDISQTEEELFIHNLRNK